MVDYEEFHPLATRYFEKVEELERVETELDEIRAELKAIHDKIHLKI